MLATTKTCRPRKVRPFTPVGEARANVTASTEKALGALIRKKYGTDFYVLDKFPEEARPFYAKEDPSNPSLTNAYE